MVADDKEGDYSWIDPEQAPEAPGGEGEGGGEAPEQGEAEKPGAKDNDALAGDSGLLHKFKQWLGLAMDGGEGSGNFGHEGRPGLTGGSGEGGTTELISNRYGTPSQDEANLISRLVAGEQMPVASTVKGERQTFIEKVEGGKLKVKTQHGDSRVIMTYDSKNKEIYLDEA